MWSLINAYLFCAPCFYNPIINEFLLDWDWTKRQTLIWSSRCYAQSFIHGRISTTFKHFVILARKDLAREKASERQENLAEFLKTNFSKLVVSRVKRRQKASFLGSINSKITLTKEKKRRKRNTECNNCTISFYNGYFVRRKKVHLAVTFSKTRLEDFFAKWSTFAT